MKLISLLFILFTLTLNAVALEVILNPYENITYDEIGAYHYDIDCPCNCNGGYYEGSMERDYWLQR